MNHSPIIGRQEAKSLKARELICRATISSLVDLGYVETSINRVAQRAGVSKGALQHHFPCKEDLIAAVVDMLLERPLAHGYPLRAGSDCSDAEIVARELRATWTDFINTGPYRALLEILMAARTDTALRQRIEPTLHNWNAMIDRQMRAAYAAVSGDDADVELLLVMNRALLRGLVIQDRYVDDPHYNARVVEFWIKMAAPLLRPRQREELDETVEPSIRTYQP